MDVAIVNYIWLPLVFVTGLIMYRFFFSNKNRKRPTNLITNGNRDHHNIQYTEEPPKRDYVTLEVSPKRKTEPLSKTQSTRNKQEDSIPNKCTSEGDLFSSRDISETTYSSGESESSQDTKTVKNLIQLSCLEAFVQTDATEKHATTQANLVPKILSRQIHRNQSVQTENGLVEHECRHSICLSATNSMDSDRSHVSDTPRNDFSKVMTLWSVPTWQKLDDNYVGHLEERAYRISRWLEESESAMESANSSRQEFSNFVSCLQSQESTIPKNLRSSPDEDLVDSSSEVHAKRDNAKEDCCCKNHRSFPEAGDSNECRFRKDQRCLEGDGTREGVSHEHIRTSPQKEKDNKMDQVKTWKRFSNYLKGQHHTLEGETIGKSHMMIQDLKEVLQKRGISN